MKPAVKYLNEKNEEIAFDPTGDADKSYEEWEKGDRKEEYVAPKFDEPAYSVIVDEDDGDKTLVVVHAASDGPIPTRSTVAEALNGVNPGAVGDMQLTFRAAYQALRQTRYMMPKGPLNNVMCFRDGTYFPDRSPTHHNSKQAPGYICEPDTPNFLFESGETLEDALKIHRGSHLGQLTALLARYYRGVRTGAGVCSTISAVATGLLTTNFPNLRNYERDHSGDATNFIKVKQTLKHGGNTKGSRFSQLHILNVSHRADHSFCLVSFGDSPWFVCDPWPQEPYVLPVEKNYFRAESIKSWQLIEVWRPLDDPFGLPLMRAWDQKASTSGDAKVPGLQITPETIEFALARYGFSIPSSPPVAIDPPFEWKSEKMTVKGKEVETEPAWVMNKHAKRTRGPCEFAEDLYFHVAKPWTHESNHMLSNYWKLESDGSSVFIEDAYDAWFRYRSRNRPAATPAEWGSHVTIDQEFKAEHQRIENPDALREEAKKAAKAELERRELEARRGREALELRKKEAKMDKAVLKDAKSRIAQLFRPPGT